MTGTRTIIEISEIQQFRVFCSAFYAATFNMSPAPNEAQGHGGLQFNVGPLQQTGDLKLLCVPLVIFCFIHEIRKLL